LKAKEKKTRGKETIFERQGKENVRKGDRIFEI